MYGKIIYHFLLLLNIRNQKTRNNNIEKKILVGNVEWVNLIIN